MIAAILMSAALPALGLEIEAETIACELERPMTLYPMDREIFWPMPLELNVGKSLVVHRFSFNAPILRPKAVADFTAVPKETVVSRETMRARAGRVSRIADLDVLYLDPRQDVMRNDQVLLSGREVEQVRRMARQLERLSRRLAAYLDGIRFRSLK